MAGYVLDHHLDGERARLALMSQLLDPMHRRYLSRPSACIEPPTRLSSFMTAAPDCFRV